MKESVPNLVMEAEPAKLLDVLLIEDNPLDAGLVTSLLGKASLARLRIQHAPCLRDALTMLAAATYDVILLDLNLGDSSGYETFDRVRRAALEAAIVVLTVSEDEELAVSTVREGAQDYLVKGSFDQRLLLRAVRYAAERKRSEDALRRSQATARAVFESSLDGIVICADNAQCLEGNQAAAALLLSTKGSLGGRNLFEFSDPDFEQQWPSFLAKGSGRTLFWVHKADGEKRLVDCSVRARIFPGQHLCVLRDITDQSGLEQQLRQSQKMEAVGRLAGGVAHEFNNLMGVIRGYAELVQANTREPAQQTRTEKIVSATERGAALTRQLLSFGRRQMVNLELVDISAMLTDLKTMLVCTLGPESQVDIRCDDGLGLVKADRIQLEQVVLNIAANARDAMPGGGMLGIAAENYETPSAHPELPPGKYVRLSFSDTGTGMDQETQLRIFEPFFTTKKTSSGLGLSTVYGIVQQIDGHMIVQSALMQGTTFVIYLPVAAGSGQEAGVVEKQEASDVVGSETILLADDETDLRNAAAEYLEAFGYHVLSAGTGTEAIEIADRFNGKISLLITDVMMPKLGGPALVDYLLKKHPGTPVMMISGFANDEMLARQDIMKSVCFLQKPFTLRMLATKIRTLLDKAQA